MCVKRNSIHSLNPFSTSIMVINLLDFPEELLLCISRNLPNEANYILAQTCRQCRRICALVYAQKFPRFKRKWIPVVWPCRVEYFLQNEALIDYSPSAVDMLEIYARTGNLNMLKSLRETKRILRFGRGTVIAARGGHEDVVLWILENSVRNNLEGRCDLAIAACECGHLKLLQYFFLKGCKMKSNGLSQCINAAATFGHVHIIKYLINAHGAVWTSEMSECAASKGRLDVLKWADEHEHGPINYEPIKRAALQYNHHHILEWYADRCNFTTTDMYLACKRRKASLQVLQFLYSRGLHVYELVIENAMREDNVDILRWLVEIGFSLQSYYLTIPNPYFVQISRFIESPILLEYAYERPDAPLNEMFNAGRPLFFENFRLFQLAVASGFIEEEEIQYRSEVTHHPKIFEWVLKKGWPLAEMFVAKCLHENDDDIIGVLQYPHDADADVIELLIRERPHLFTSAMCTIAVENNKLEIVQILTQRNLWDSNALQAAKILKRTAIIKWYEENGYNI